MRPNVEVSAAGISRMNSISTKFEKAVAFSNGKALLTLKKPPPLVPSCLMAILGGHRAERERLLEARESSCTRPSR